MSGGRAEMNITRVSNKLVSLMLLALSLVETPGAFAWGNEGHTYINRVAAQKIPADMPRFLRRAAAEIAYLGPEPDRWRNPAEAALKNSQEPDHFIDLERVDWLNPLPPVRYEFYRKLYEKRAAEMHRSDNDRPSNDHPANDHPDNDRPKNDRPKNDHPNNDHPNHDLADDYLPERVGLQPYIVAEIYGRLKSSFREYRSLRAAHQPTASVQQAIIFYAGWLGHYVADGSQPLHTTIHYNGWVGPNPKQYTTEHGIHSQFETKYVAQNITAKDFAGFVHAPEHLTDQFGQYVRYLRDSNQLVEDVYALEKAGGFNGKGSPQAFEFTTHRLAAGSQMLLNLWYSAWLDSATPDAPAATVPPAQK